MPGTLAGKIAIVTGGSTGIGLATARCFAAEGARVFVTGRRAAELAGAVAAIGPNATGIQANSSSLADLDRLYEQVRAEAGHIDVLFANAGGGSFLPLGAITEEQYEDTFSRNVKGTLFTVQKALPLLADGASVILTGSTAASSGTPAFSVYAASKAAIRAFARNWILDVQGRGIRINVLSPGPSSRGRRAWSDWRDPMPRSSRACWTTCRDPGPALLPRRMLSGAVSKRSPGRRCSWPQTLKCELRQRIGALRRWRRRPDLTEPAA